MLTYFILGAAIGAITGVPIGPVNVAVIESAYRHNLKRAIAVGVGGGVADCLYALLGVLGVGPFLRSHPTIPPILYAVSGVVLLVFGFLTMRTRSSSFRQVTSGARVESGQLWMGFVVGVALILMNPAAIITWVIIVGSFLVEATQAQGVAAALGIGAGSFLWFALVAFLADKGKQLLGERAVWITRVVGALLMGYGVFSLGRAAYWVLTH